MSQGADLERMRALLSLAANPTSAAGFTSPPEVGIHVIAINPTSGPMAASRASRSSAPAASEGITSIFTPSRLARCR